MGQYAKILDNPESDAWNVIQYCVRDLAGTIEIKKSFKKGGI